ncbi:NAD(P)-binding protein [Sodiomyces alkalinus F11]|uniref:Dehydrogenase FUB6 n=1 Tax=Sodiomyces alkalinus (strain CBS 110278 / VKM F-3762 / F11) TaxID=1314773 RepID=A0A3N2PVR3_SODAK|nr:NAD(P)-binding protein [Sodiomyces alkalinus F11]ROT38591.1 NAD(P)-binding protein [Sodiomyces alkalinus F11]
MAPNKTLVFKKIPTGAPVPGEHLAVEDHPTDIDTPPKGGLVLEVLYASFDPYLRGKMRDPSIKSYAPAFEIGDPIVNGVAATVRKSDNPDYVEGDTVVAMAPIAQYARVEDPQAAQVQKIHNPHGLDLALFLGPLGMPGLTAWSALYKIGKPKKGETIFVSSAAGAVGQVVGQVAKREGLTVIGSVGSDAKLDFITKELGFDAGFNYKKESPFDALKRLAPNGIDIYFENVGGEHLEAALENMNMHGRIPICGMISDYNKPREEQRGVRGLLATIRSNITLEGFLVFQPEFGPAYTKEHQEKLQQWISNGSVKAKLHVTEGIDNAAEGLVGLLEGKNFGKAVLKVK